MKKRVFVILLILSFAVTAIGLPAPSSAFKVDGVKVGLYRNNEFNANIAVNPDHTWSAFEDFGYGMASVYGSWRVDESDYGEVFLICEVDKRSAGKGVDARYTFALSYLDDNEILVKVDGSFGKAPTESIFVFEFSEYGDDDNDYEGHYGVDDGVDDGFDDEYGYNSEQDADAAIANARGKISKAVGANALSIAAKIKAAAASANRYTGYRGAAVEEWAIKEIGMADYLDLMPGSVSDYFFEETRRDHFAELALNCLIKLTGMTRDGLKDIAPKRVFWDCYDEAVLVCAGLGIINGYPDRGFHPESPITRQEAAAILSRLADTIGARGKGSTANFADISGLWGEKEIKYVSTLRDPYTGNAVMGGVGNNKFDPHGTYNRQQAVATILRMAGAAADSHENP